MKLNNMNKRGISPLIATILLVALTIIIAIIVFNFFQTAMNTNINETDQTVNIYLQDVEFEFICTNIENRTDPDPANWFNSTEILFINEHSTQIDSAVVKLEDNTMNSVSINLTAWNSTYLRYSEYNWLNNTINSEIEITPQIYINGVLEGLPTKTKTEECGHNILFSSPGCSDYFDNDGDGVNDTDDPDCWDDIYDPSTYNFSIENEEGTWSCNSCEDCEIDIINHETSGGDKYYLFKNNGNYNTTSSCLDVGTDQISDLTIDCSENRLVGDSDEGDHGIRINNENSKNIIIKNCEFYRFDSSILIEKGDSITIEENLFNEGFSDGESIKLDTSSTNITISNNTEIGTKSYFLFTQIRDVNIINNSACESARSVFCFGGDTTGLKYGNTFGITFMCSNLQADTCP